MVEDLIKAGNADAIESVDEYYPETIKVDGIPYYNNGNSNPTLIADIDYNDNNTNEYYNLQGMKVNKPTRGIVIEKRGKTIKKRIY